MNILNLNIEELQELCHKRALDRGWYTDLETGKQIIVNPGERCMLITSEISEAFEGIRSNKMDDKLPHRIMAEVEFADAIIRILDYAGYMKYDIAGAIQEKMAYNLVRTDHNISERVKENGKKF